MLDLIRGKRVVFVGDSINRNQWESMLCMLLGAVKDPKKVYETHHRRITKEKGNYSFRFVVTAAKFSFFLHYFLLYREVLDFFSILLCRTINVQLNIM